MTIDQGLDQGVPTGHHSHEVDGADDRLVAVAGAVPFVGVQPSLTALAGLRLLRHVAGRPALLAGESRRLVGELAAVLAGSSPRQPEPDDRRFRDPAYRDHPLFRRLAQAHLALEASIGRLLTATELDWKSQQRARFVLDTITEALAPSNILLGNPAALRRLRDTRGASMLRGARNALEDLRHHGGLPSLADRRAFRVGTDLAATPGAVVLRTDMFELIQYLPAEPAVHQRPVLFVPSQVNRFYVVDLTPQRSMVRYLIGRGIQPFALSWRNPGVAERDWSLDSYVAAVRHAVKATAAIAGAPVNVAGVCAGGVTSALAISGWRQARRLVNSLTLAVSVADTSDPSMIGAFNTRRAADSAAARSRRRGILRGVDLGRTFALMRPRDLLWSLWVHNYLLGEDPPANDVLFWSDDTTNLPARLHADYLELYVRNPLSRATDGRRSALAGVRCDCYVVNGLADHIAPWRGGWRTAAALGGDTTFVAATGGHIQATLAVPGRPNRYAAGPLGDGDPDTWLAAAPATDGSWWEHWCDWLTPRSGELVDAPAEPGTEKFPALEPAPGRYVHG